MKKISMMTMAAIALLAGAARSGDITESQARTVAANFAKGDSSLKSRTVEAVTKRGNLWIVSLKPSGYVAVSANDAAYPIAVFAKDDFTEPAEGSTAAGILNGVDADIGAATGDGYRALWDRLLGVTGTTGGVRRLAVQSASVVVDTETEVRVSVPTAWQQCQPFNDFMPIEYASGNSINTIYRGRRFLGCVPTAYVQLMNYWKWPEVIDNDTSEELNIPAEKYAGVNPIASYTPRIKAGTAMDWNDTQSQYPLDVSSESGVSSGVYDLRGYFSEKKRQSVGRACLLSQILSKASLMTTGTGATLTQPTYNDWYELPVGIGHGSSGGESGTDPDSYFGEVRKALKAGIPMLVGIDVKSGDGWIGHAVVGTGWKYENDSHWFELNYGWGGGSAYHSYETIKAHLGSAIPQRPKPKPILVNQPEMSALPLTLSWHFPSKGWNDVLTGFKVMASEYGMTLADATDTFDENPGMASGENSASVFTGKYATIDNDTSVLIVKPEGKYGTKTYYTWNDPKTLSDTSALSFRMRANDTRGIEVTLQVNIDGAGWSDACKLARSDNAIADWTTVNVPLATGNAGKSIRCRLFIEKIASANGQWQDSAPVGYMIDDFTVTDVESIGASNPIEVASVEDPEARSVTIEKGLSVGTRYALCVHPVFSEGTGVDSDYIPVMIVDEALAAPQFVSVASVSKNTSAPVVKEACFRECALGRNYLTVEGSSTMTDLKAYSSHVSILPDSMITVDAVPNHAGRYLVSIDASGIPALGGRQRIMLTLVGSNAYGAKVQKDLTLRFSEESVEEPITVAADLDDSGDTPSGGDEPGEEDDPEDDPDEQEEETPVVTPTFPKADGAGPNDDTTAKTRFCPGVTLDAGCYDVTRSGSGNRHIPVAYNLVYWWVDRHQTALGKAPDDYSAPDTASLPYSEGTYTIVSYTAKLLDEAFTTTLRTAADRLQYFPATAYTAAAWHGDGDESTWAKATGKAIYAALAKGPIGCNVSTSASYGYAATIWGCAYAEDGDERYATALYITDTTTSTRSDTLVLKEFGLVENSSGVRLPGIKAFNGTNAGTIDDFYPISAPEPEASGNSEVTVKVTAGGREFDITKAFSKVEKGAGNVVTYTLDPAAKVKVKGEGDVEEEISVKPELADGEDEKPFEVQDGKLVFKVKSIPGLKYQVLASDTLDPDSFTPAGQAREATGTRRELTVTRSGETMGFYRIQVSR